MNVLIVGGGGREHALARSFAASPQVDTVYAAPGNAGMKQTAVCVDLNEKDAAGLTAFAEKADIGLTVVGPEAPLLDGVVNAFQEAGLTVFGPTKEAAVIEGSKSFAKAFMERRGIPTGTYKVTSEYDDALQHVENEGVPIVIKADGLAAGKGVTVAFTKEEAEAALRDILLDDKFGEAGARVVLEEYLEGEELSLMAFVHGTTVVPMVGAQDHKRAYDGDIGPNTGGMGAYSPVPQFDDADINQAVREILQPAADGLAEEGRPFTGILYAGLMMTGDGPKVVEFNARFGDPEAQVVLPRLESDPASVITELLDGGCPSLSWAGDAVLGVVAASKGYPGPYHKGVPIADVPDSDLLFFAGAGEENGTYVTAGGRVLLLAEKAATLKEAQTAVYEKLKDLDTTHLFYRTDIGRNVIKD